MDQNPTGACNTPAAATGTQTPFTDTTAHWTPSQSSFGLTKGATYTYAQIKQILDLPANTSKKYSGSNAVQILEAHFSFANASTTATATGILSALTLKYTAAKNATSYTFGTN